ncbi:Uncharacterised protein [uncultured Clostridium sp.]|uniref:hypothetical protein n=1 Tax=uncultured Clostridium sp. TaxID=59620 RepID=UPI0008227143|nr:hypothetical protein [uncultured Clostridium sp.]SCJ63671.1 Uncharacterised protein [uncultured Clostridium sp.]
MAKKYSKHKKNKDSTGKTSSEFNDKEKFKLQILATQQLVVVLNIYGQVLLYEATLLGNELVKTHFTNNELQIKADTLVQQAVKIFFIAGLISFELAMINYDKANEDIRSGANYSIQPNIDLLTANTLNVTAGIYYIKAANGLYDRDNLQPIFGFR